MAFEEEDFENVRKLVKIAREEHVISLSLGGITVHLTPASWIFEELQAARTRAETKPLTAEERAAQAEKDAAPRMQIGGRDIDDDILFASSGDAATARRAMPGYTPREEKKK